MRRVLSVVSAMILVLTTLLVGSSPASADDQPAILDIQKEVIDPVEFGPGDTFSYGILVNCSSTIVELCLGAEVTDVLPAPLILDPDIADPVTASIPSGVPPLIEYSEDRNGFTVTPQYAIGEDVGLKAGNQMMLTVQVKVPATISADYNGQTVTNTAHATADNADPVEDSADVTLKVTTTLAAGVAKSVAPATVGARPGQAVAWTISPSNQSNQTVDQMVVEDVFTGTNRSYLDFVSLDASAAPETTDTTTIEYLVEGAWTETAPENPADVEGVRVTYDGSYAPGASGTLRINTVTNDTVVDIADQSSVTVNNTATAVVAKDEDETDPVQASSSMTIVKADPDVTITKTLDDSTLVIGQEVTATLHAAVGVQDVHELVIHEPSAGQPGFTEQGLEFTGFGDALEWPQTAVSATIVYTYADGSTSTATTTAVDTLPAPEAGTVEGFTVTFTAAEGVDGIRAAAYANLPIELTALTDIDAALSSVNHVDTVVTTVDGASGDDADSADFTIRPLEVFTTVDKQITPDEIWAAPGADALVTLSAGVRSDSTIGSDRLIISDPVDPTQAGGFFDAFTVTHIENTDIPACSTLTVRYWSIADQAWTVVPGAEAVAGPADKWGIEVPAAIRADLGGIQLDFAPSNTGCPEVLPPGFNVISYVGVELKDDVPNETATIDNDVQSEVYNSSIDKGHTDQSDDSVDLRPTDSGPGPDLVDKFWLDNTVPALSSGQRTARVGWSTDGLNFGQVTITDPATTAELGPNAPEIATSVYDAFNLVAIPAITPVVDPLIVNDQVSKVELFVSGAWVDVTTQACASELACRGTFPGLTLDTTQQANTTGARITFTELVAGAGVGSSYARRPLDLRFQLRDTLRSNPSQYALGTYHDHTYNTGEPGLVRNTVRVEATGRSGSFASTDADDITIIDSPVNVTLNKEFDQDQLGLPILGTVDPDDFPLISATLTARNTSAVRIASLTVTDPGPDQADPTAYEVLDLHQIASITVPSGLTADDVAVVLDRSGTATSYTRAQALALTAAQLADVTGVTLEFARADGAPVIASNAVATAELVFQLREDKRSDGSDVEVTSPGGVPIVNEAHVQAESPGRIVCVTTTTPGCSPGFETYDDEFNIVSADFEVAGSKTITPASIYENQSRAYTTQLVGRPQGSARATLLTLTDDAPTFWNVMDYTGSSITLPTPINQARMDVLTATGWVDGAWVASMPGGTVTFALPTGVAAADVIGVRYQFQRVVSGEPVQWERPFNPRIQVNLNTTRRLTQRDSGDPVSTTRPNTSPNAGETELGVISNDLDVFARAQFGPNQATFTDQQNYQDDTLVRHRVNAIQVEKGPGNATRPPTYSPFGNVPYVLTITNTGAWDMTGFAVVDQFDLVDGQSPVVEPDPTQYSFSLTTTNPANPVPIPAPAFTADFDPDTARLTVNMPDGFVFRSGWRLTVNAPMTFAPGLPADTVVRNAVTATADRPFETCDYTTNRVTPGQTTHVDDCTAVTNVQPLASAVLSMRKGVKGDQAGAPGTSDDDLGVVDLANGTPSLCAAPEADGFYRGNCVPVTRPGGEQTWQLEMTNGGNTNAKVIAVVDTLPAVGDRGPNTGSLRQSQFDVTLRSKVDSTVAALADNDIVLRAYYSTARLSAACNRNAIDVHTSNATPSAGCAFDWTEYTSDTPDAELEAAETVKFVMDWGTTAEPGDGLHPGETVRITFNTRTPAELPQAFPTGTALPVAWNSFAGTSRTVATSTQGERSELIGEPPRVGVATATGRLTLDKLVDAPEFSVPVTLPGSYTFDLECTSAGAPVTLRDATGAPWTGPVTVAVDADGNGSTVVNAAGSPLSVPLFAECTVAENPVPAGATATMDPADGTVIADRSLADVPGIQHPYEGEPNGLTVTTTNEYTHGGFSFAKVVDNGGAVDENGDPVVYDREYVFDVECRYLGNEILAEEVTLEDGDTQSYEALPTGSECSVTETDSAGAAVTVTIDGEDADNPAEFTIGDDTEVELEFTNTFDIGSVRIEKAFTGPGADAWGDQPVQVRLVCEIDGVTTETVFDDTRTLTNPDELVWQVHGLPMGASCLVTEPRTGGANDTQITDAAFEIDSTDTSVEVAIENFFDQGAVTVLKTISGDGADFEAVQSGAYTMSLVCTREVDGETLDVTVPGGAERVITGAGEATWEGLPTGADCVVSESDTLPTPQDVTITPDGGAVVVPAGDADPVEVTVDNRFDAGFLKVNKLVDGPGEGLHAAASYAFDVVCTLADQPVLSEQLTLERGDGGTSLWSDAIGPMPTGTSCVVTETQDGGADGTTGTATVVIDAGTAEEAVVATITNTYGAGTVEVTKETGGEYAEHPEALRTRFAMTLTCQLETADEAGATTIGTVYESDFTLRAGRTKTFTGDDGRRLLLPTGTRCFVEETDDGGATEVEIDHDSFENGAVVESVDTTAQLAITVTNVFDANVWDDNLEDDPGLKDDNLSDSGSPVGAGWIALGALSVLAGGAALAGSRRRSRDAA